MASTHPGPLLPPSWNMKGLHFPTPWQLEEAGMSASGWQEEEIVSPWDLALEKESSAATLRTLVPDGLVTVLEGRILVIDIYNFGWSKLLGLKSS